ncbi:hypothetical protein [Rhizobium hidalgonense]|uniref:hypothetical protein n=1 Tax=Rhizobium hidalgonense TaxID=1538159 RepID=UPI0013E2D464|nr:hypothetical protein [Rhizobium hidalgonense]QKK25926.1 hypothetical protein FFM81_024515 [Rhizobium hidalgonense]
MFIKIRLLFPLPSIMPGTKRSLMMAFGIIVAGIGGSTARRGDPHGAIRTLDIATPINGAIAVVILTMVVDRITQSAARFWEQNGRGGSTSGRDTVMKA